MIATVVLYACDAYEAWRFMTTNGFLAWVVMAPSLAGVLTFIFLLLRPRSVAAQNADDVEWPKPLAYGLILTPVVLLLFMAVAAPLRGGFDDMRWMFPVAGSWIGAWTADLMRPMFDTRR